MKYCRRCVMPDTRPGLVIDEKTGICSACKNYERRQKVNWKNRWKELEELCDKYKESNGENYYDCIITVSGGKDSHYQVYVIKEQMHMNPLLVSVDNYSWTETGRKNKDNMSEVFGCDILTMTMNKRAAKKIMRHAFEKLGSPTIAWDKALYSYPLWMGIKLGIPLIWYGENISATYGGPNAEDLPSALNQINNAAVKPVPDSFWFEAGASSKEIWPFTYPSEEEIKRACLNPQYLSYYVPWSSWENKELAKAYGFLTLDDTREWHREGFCEQYDQIDSRLYIIHPQIKSVKFGHARITDVCSNWIREGRITREAAIDLVREHDLKFDPKAVKEFCKFLDYTEEEFWKIIERHRNKELFVKDANGDWEIKNPIWGRGNLNLYI